MYDFLLTALKIWRGNTWHKAALALIIAGIVSITSIVQYVLPPVGASLGIRIVIPETPLWASFALIVIGVIVLVLSREGQSWRSQPNPHDVQLLQQFRKLITPAVLAFLRGHDFRIPFRRDALIPLEMLTENWQGAHYEFQYRRLQVALQMIRTNANAFLDKIAERTYPADGNAAFNQPLTRVDEREGIQQSTLAAIKQMNELCRATVKTIDDFERLARRVMPNVA